MPDGPLGRCVRIKGNPSLATFRQEEQRESTEPLCIDVVSLLQAQMVRVFGLQSRDQKFELGKAA
jgi:hypothetical protein